MFKLSLSAMTQVWVYLVTLYFLLLLQRFPLRGPYQEQLLSHSVILSWLSRSHGELALYRAQSLLSEVLIHFKKNPKGQEISEAMFLGFNSLLIWGSPQPTEVGQYIKP